jgi:predicted acyl esterase
MQNVKTGVDERIEVLFRQAAPIDVPEALYPGFNPGTTVLPKGFVQKKGALPLPSDILFERDVAVTLRDGTVIYTDIFRPVGGANLPAIIAWSPYGKKGGLTLLDDFPFRAGVARNAVSELQKWEGPDPAYWCHHGYAVVNPDARGAFSSNGDIHFWGKQEGQDGYDVIEWVADQEWSNGKVGLSGNSWLAIAQWFIAAERPPHLAAIAPWEGWSDAYREDVGRGGMQDLGFCERITSKMRGKNRVEDVPAMMQKYPLINGYWKDKIAKLENIDIPAYVVASWTSMMHAHGTLDSYRRIPSKDKWLRVHNTQEWPDYYDPKYMEDLRRFFDRYLKGIENGWEKTSRVRLSVLDPGGVDEINRPENEFPLARTQYKSLYLDGRSGTLSPNPVTEESLVRYAADDGKGQAVFTIRFNEETELTGYMKLRLWVEAVGSNDMDLFVKVQKLNKGSKVLSSPVIVPPNPVARTVVNRLWSFGIQKLSLLFFTGPAGRLRVSHRALDAARSTPSEPYLTHRAEELLSPGQIVPVEIGIWPAGMRWHVGEQLRVSVAGYNPTPVPVAGINPPVLRNKGEHVIHTGGKYDSHLLVPVISRGPSKIYETR